jgi:hypothetical protein
VGCGVIEPGSGWCSQNPQQPQDSRTTAIRRSVDSSSVLDLPGPLASYGVAHGLQLLRRMTDPVEKLAYDAQ